MKKVFALLIIILCFTGCLSKQEGFITDVKEDTINYNLNYKNEFIERKNNIVENDFEKWDNLLNDIYKYLQNNMNAEEFEKLKKDELDWIKFKEDALKKFPENSDNIKITYTKERCNYLVSLFDDMKYVKDDSIFYEEDDAIYYFVEGHLVGLYKDGKYISHDGQNGNLESNTPLRKLLSKPGYDLYDMREKIGAVKEINEFILPFDLEKEPENLEYEYNHVYINVENDSHRLATNATHNLFPREFEIYESDVGIEKIVKEIQETNNFYIEEPIDVDNTIILCDLEGDGEKEKLLVSNVLYDKFSCWEELPYSNEKVFTHHNVDEWDDAIDVISETFSIMAIIKNNGEYDVVYIGDFEEISFVGIYDVDNDEEYEICAEFGNDGWYTGVLDKVNNEWKLVMRSGAFW